MYSHSNIPPSVKSQSVPLYHQAARAEEEITRLKEEMNCCVEHYISKYECLKDGIFLLENSERKRDSFSEGSLYLLKKALRKCKCQLQTLKCFTKYTELPQLEYVLCSFSGKNSTEVPYLSSNLGDEVDDPDTTSLRCPEDTPLESKHLTDDEFTDNEPDEKEIFRGMSCVAIAVMIVL